MDEITIEGKVYVSSKQAAKITGYAKDYVGQLCREGRVNARLVGRNWYVLEDSIREHRFGPGSVAGEAVDETREPVSDRTSEWQKPQYVPEVPAFVPDLVPKPEAPAPVSSPAIEDMQSAWKEWFEEKRPVPALPDGSEDFKDEYLPVIVPEEPREVVEEVEEEEPVMISRTPSAPVYEAPEPEEESEVELHRSYASRSTGERVPTPSPAVVDLSHVQEERGRVLSERRVRPQRATSSIASRAVFAVIAVLAILVAIVGTGNADRLLAGTSFDFGVQKSLMDYLGGTSTYESSL